MGDVYDRNGRKVGTVNAWSGVYDAHGRKVGTVQIFTSKVYDASGRFVGTADPWGKVRGPSGNLLCTVPFLGSDVRAADGSYLGSVGIAGAPEPPPDMQWRGAAALLLLCGCREEAVADPGQLAREFVTRPTEEGRDRLAGLGVASVRPVLRALVEHMAGWGAGIRSEAERQRIQGRQWDEVVRGHFLGPSLDLVEALGEPGVAELCRALRDADGRVQKAAALLLLSLHSQSRHTYDLVREAVSGALIRDTSTERLVALLLALGGDEYNRERIWQHAQLLGLDAAGWHKLMVDTALLELLGWRREVPL